MLAPFSSMGIGGPADLFYKLTNIEELPTLLSLANDLQIPYFILGGGSNVIFADEGFRGLVIQMQAKKIALKDDLIEAESGALLSQVIQFALKNQLTGMEKLMGLPGTIGGAVRGNAGAFGTETKDFVTAAEIFSPTTASPIKLVTTDYLNFAYRSSKIKTSGEIILKVYLKLPKATPEQAKSALAEAMEIIKNRISKQPKGKCSGSFFKNPDGTSVVETQNPAAAQLLKAGALLEQSGCKGLKQGDAQVSPQHANWIMNLGHATQKDILALKEAMQTRVKATFKLTLEPEVQFVGQKGPI